MVAQFFKMNFKDVVPVSKVYIYHT